MSRLVTKPEWTYTDAMVTDNWPVRFRYISRRLVKEIVQQHQAASSSTTWSLSVTLKGLGLALARRDPDYLNLFDLARRATEAVRDQIGTVADPGEYVRDELLITPGYLTVLLGWKDRTHVDIAAMMARYQDETVGSVMIGLFGSMSNYVWRRPESDQLGEIPSDVAGLYEVLERTREADDPEIDPERVEDEEDIIPASRPDTIARLIDDRFSGFQPQRLDILMQVFYSYQNVSLWGEHIDRVIIGTPVWAATPSPRPLT